MTDLSLWQTASLPNTVDHVLERYHATHRRQLADAAQLAATKPSPAVWWI